MYINKASRHNILNEILDMVAISLFWLYVFCKISFKKDTSTTISHFWGAKGINWMGNAQTLSTESSYLKSLAICRCCRFKVVVVVD